MQAHILDASETPARSGWLQSFRKRWVRWTAALAVVLFGVFVTLSIWAEPGSPVAFHGDTLLASGRLQQVLNDPSAGGHEHGPTAGKGFTDKAGRSCRPFAQGAIDGIACRIEGKWRVIEMRQR
jgi:hypothetical protein